MKKIIGPNEIRNYVEEIRWWLGEIRRRKREEERRKNRKNYLLPEDWPRGWQDLMKRSEELEAGLSDEERREIDEWEKSLDT